MLQKKVLRKAFHGIYMSCVWSAVVARYAWLQPFLVSVLLASGSQEAT